jgi:hypothetical protein
VSAGLGSGVEVPLPEAVNGGSIRTWKFGHPELARGYAALGDANILGSALSG